MAVAISLIAIAVVAFVIYHIDAQEKAKRTDQKLNEGFESAQKIAAETARLQALSRHMEAMREWELAKAGLTDVRSILNEYKNLRDPMETIPDDWKAEPKEFNNA